MPTMRAVYEAMKSYNRHVTYGSECNAWGDFVADSYGTLDHAPWDSPNDAVPDEWSFYWMQVAEGKSPDYVAETGDRREDA